jgi:hypothetical protein
MTDLIHCDVCNRPRSNRHNMCPEPWGAIILIVFFVLGISALAYIFG